MVRSHQPGESVFRAILPEEIEWKPFAAFPPTVRLAVLVGDPSQRSNCEMHCGTYGACGGVNLGRRLRVKSRADSQRGRAEGARLAIFRSNNVRCRRMMSALNSGAGRLCLLFDKIPSFSNRSACAAALVSKGDIARSTRTGVYAMLERLPIIHCKRSLAGA
jgi:hypothetical protein